MGLLTGSFGYLCALIHATERGGLFRLTYESYCMRLHINDSHLHTPNSMPRAVNKQVAFSFPSIVLFCFVIRLGLGLFINQRAQP